MLIFKFVFETLIPSCCIKVFPIDSLTLLCTRCDIGIILSVCACVCESQMSVGVGVRVCVSADETH